MDQDYKDKIAQDLYEKIHSTNKPFSHEEVGNMALGSLDRIYVKLTEESQNKKVGADIKRVPMQLEGSQQNIKVDGESSALIKRLQKENRELRQQLDKVNGQKTELQHELSRARIKLGTMETNCKDLADLLKEKQSEVSENKRRVTELAKVNTDVNDESLAVQAQMEEIRQFAIRSQQAAAQQMKDQHMKQRAQSAVVPPANRGGEKPGPHQPEGQRKVNPRAQSEFIQPPANSKDGPAKN
eukprot:UN25613